ncbi:MAG TPA: hypothetical protein VGF71_00030 [Caulobacteraceae bacterium]
MFALEHGLSNDEIDEISRLLRERLRSNLSLSPFWLLWAIYGAELGYAYVGDEYWQSFEQKTPYWDDHDRYRLAAWFRKFQETYYGVAPTGQWASHFRLIAWPITHAILPQYLQRQFARALYDLRFRLASLVSLNAAAIGHLLAAQAHGSSRFHEFLQQEELTGRIVLAVLGHTPKGGVEPIEKATLDRIVGDLEEVRASREWLKEARRVVRDRFVGLARGAAPGMPRPPSTPHEVPSNPSIRPNLSLRYSGQATWALLADLPDLRPLATTAEIREFLRTTRCQLNGADTPRPAGWLFGSRRSVVLKTWPNANRPLVKFERHDAVVEGLLGSDCRISRGPSWLFRIGSDGIAREITGRIVRPGQSYILVGTDALPKPEGWIAETGIDCAGVSARRLDVPVGVSAQEIARLQSAQLQLAKTIRVWPAGLPGRGWNGEGSSEWLTTESPCLGLVHDHPIVGYVLSLDGGAEAIIEAGAVGFPSFLRLAPLPAGVHFLSARALRDPSLQREAPAPEAEGHLMLNVREPEPWHPGQPLHTGLIVTVDPNDGDLDTFWDDRISLTILGPESRQVHCRVTLAKSDGTEVLSATVGEAFNLPVLPAAWSRQFRKFAQHDDTAATYVEATAGCLIVEGEDLGEFRIPFERVVLPIRWQLRRQDSAVSARLVNDTGKEGMLPTVIRYDMRNPLLGNELSPREAAEPIQVGSPGSLLVASLGDYEDHVVISTTSRGSSLQDLGVAPTFAQLESGAISAPQALATLKRWSDARLVGPLAAVRLDQVKAGLVSAIYERICGEGWARSEAAFRSSSSGQTTLDDLKSHVDGRTGFAAVINLHFRRMDGNFTEGAAWYADLSRRYKVCAQPATCVAALWFASDPARLAADLSDGDLERLTEELAANPAVLRGARLLALLSANRGQPGSELLPRWSW